MRFRILRSSAVLAVAIVSLANLPGCGSEGVGAPRGAVRSTRVNFHANAGIENERILNLGGLVVRASCIDYGQGRKYLSLGAKTTIDNASRALVLSQRRGDQTQSYSFKSSDFDRSFGWYDFTGTNPYDTAGTLRYARPDGGQVALTFRADENTPRSDCAFDGSASYLP